MEDKTRRKEGRKDGYQEYSHTFLPYNQNQNIDRSTSSSRLTFTRRPALARASLLITVRFFPPFLPPSSAFV